MSSVTYFAHKGIPFAEGEYSVDILSYVENEFQLLDDDTVVVTYPKSGEFLEEFLSGNVLFGSWFDHVKSWIGVKDRPNVYFVSYEELQQDMRGTVQKICHFLGKELTCQQLDSVVENASFQKMKDSEMLQPSQLPEELFEQTKGSLLRK
ncbi:sulfotransferase 2B1-like, partial [Varanus komodoensis]|uniref:sulfotransferase 2B1-like n=1 Tax=Varanus komodoensis TaxID=61221 RepID=UPI001CF7DE2A